MKSISTKEKINWFLLMLGYFTAGYMTINWITSQKTFFYDLSLPFEHGIPFIPAFILGYACVYGGMAVACAIIDNVSDWQRAIVGFFIATTVCYLFFMLVPVKMTMRPDVSAMTGFHASLTNLIFHVDLPYNCFPSLHVTYPTFATLIVWKNHKVARWAVLAMAVIVAISVIFVKQHYVADVIAGLCVALGSFWVTVKTEGVWGRLFKKA
ncbi:MAG: phosphatase PAP2 family protein [Deltaproteobacteria bacterium]|jgi:membrane-associated phospholipid phosphatase|nr:phosphatase PAP2 family protein [Deltaproteobacteria bacterium]